MWRWWDPATRHADFALAILHRQPDGCIVVDRVAKWTGTKSAPLVTRVVLGEIRTILHQYGLNSAIGDQYCFDVIKQEFLELGIYYENRVFGLHTRAEIFGNLKHLLLQQRIQLVDDPELLRQLRHLHEEKTARGQIDIRASGDVHDDLAVAVALAATELVKLPSGPTPYLVGAQTNVAGVWVEKNLQGVEHNILPSNDPRHVPVRSQVRELPNMPGCRLPGPGCGWNLIFQDGPALVLAKSLIVIGLRTNHNIGVWTNVDANAKVYGLREEE